MNEKRFETIEAFAEAVRIEIEQRLQKKATIQKIDKNNGIMLYGLTVVEDKINISPTIYLEPYYDVYENEGMEYILDKIERVYEENRCSNNIDISGLLDYENIKGKLTAGFINYKMNEKFLENVPHRRFLDLAIIVFINVDVGGVVGKGIITVKNNIQAEWGISQDELINKALENVRENTNIFNIEEIVDLSVLGVNERVEMYVASNKKHEYGAVAVMQKDLLKVIADKMNSDELIIIPSSIHECLLLNGHDMMKHEYDEIRKMIREINQNIVKEQEVLSYNFYIYSSETDEIRIA